MTAVDAVSVMRRNREHNKRFAALQLCILREISKLKVTVFYEMPSHAFFSYCFITVSLSLSLHRGIAYWRLSSVHWLVSLDWINLAKVCRTKCTRWSN